MTTALEALVDRLVIDAADVLDADPEIAGATVSDKTKRAVELAARDRDAVDASWLGITEPRRALERLDAWAQHCWERYESSLSGGDVESLAIALNGPARARGRLWGVAALIVTAARADWIGLSPVLTASSPDGSAAWAAEVITDRPQRFALRSWYEGSQLCLWSAFGPDELRWENDIGPEELPLPEPLTMAYSDLAARNDEFNIDGDFPTAHLEESARIWSESQELLTQWQQLLGPAYDIRFPDRDPWMFRRPKV